MPVTALSQNSTTLAINPSKPTSQKVSQTVLRHIKQKRKKTYLTNNRRPILHHVLQTSKRLSEPHISRPNPTSDIDDWASYG
jgi:hypothetical protein